MNENILPNWEELPRFLKKEEIKPYYEIIKKKKNYLLIKRIFDILISSALLILLMPIFIICSIFIKFDSKGNIFFRQRRVTKFGKIFYIIKFRTMKTNLDENVEITLKNDSRITNVGRILRKFRIDEFPQLINILLGDMTFVGVRPEIEKFVNEYSNEMRSTLLLPSGLTSMASIEFKDEADIIGSGSDYFSIYLQKILPQKMKYNLLYIRNFNFFEDFKILVLTIVKVIS